MLTAELDDQVVSDIGPNGHSIFTYYLTEGLKNFVSNGSITATELITYVRENVGNDQSSHQTPDYGFLVGHESGGDFVFINKAKSSSSGWLRGLILFDEEDGKKSQEMQKKLEDFMKDKQNAETLQRIVSGIMSGQIDPRKIITR